MTQNSCAAQKSLNFILSLGEKVSGFYTRDIAHWQIDDESCNVKGMIVCLEALPESQVLGNTNTTVLSIEDIGRVGTLFHNLHVGCIAVVPWAQVWIEDATDDAFIAEKDKTIAGPVIGVDVQSLTAK